MPCTLSHFAIPCPSAPDNEAAVPAAWANHDCCTIGCAGRWSMQGDSDLGRLERAVTNGSLIGPERQLFGFRGSGGDFWRQLGL